MWGRVRVCQGGQDTVICHSVRHGRAPNTRSAVVWKADGPETSWVNARDFVLKMTRHVFVHAGCLQGGLSAQVHQGTCDGEAEAQTGTLGR